MSGPLARSIADLRLGLAAMAAPDPRDPWWAPAPLEGPAPKRVALCFYPDGLETEPAVVKALQDAARRLGEAGWRVDTLDAIPPLKEAADLQIRMWLADGYDAMVEAARKEGDRGALVAGRAARTRRRHGPGQVLRPAHAARHADAAVGTVLRRVPGAALAGVGRAAFPDQLDLAGDEAYARVWRAQMPQIGVPFMGLPALSVAMGSVSGAKGTIPVGVQLMAGRYREDLCLAAGEVIEAAGQPIDIAEPEA